MILVLARIDQSMFDDFDTFKININEMIEKYMEEKRDILNDYEEKCEMNEPFKKFIDEDKFIHVKYIMGMC